MGWSVNYGIVVHLIGYMLYNQTHNHPWLKERRQQLRNHATRAEKTLWNALKGKQLNGFKFRRQHSVDFFILDFYCPELKLAIEVDGPSHLGKEAQGYDEFRQRYIEDHNIQFLRFTNTEVYQNLEGVIETILNWVDVNNV